MPARASACVWFLLLAIAIACGGRAVEQSGSTADRAGGFGGVASGVGSAGFGGVVSPTRGGASGDGNSSGAGNLSAGAGSVARGGLAGLGGVSGNAGGGASGNANAAGSAGASGCGEAAGVPCGTNACVPGTPCNPDGDLCHAGVTSCSTGQAMCLFKENAADGTSCSAVSGSAQVCMNGLCGSCGAPCVPAGNPCQTGILSCSTAQPTCVATGNAENTTLCGASGICCGGMCAACPTTTNTTNYCTSSETCQVSCNGGTTLCGGRCVDTSRDSNGCGASCQVCAAGSTCINSECSFEYEVFGHPIAFSPCNTVNGSIPSGILVATPVSLSAGMVTGLGLVSTQSGVVTMALYSSNESGSPLSPVVQTASSDITPGPNELLTPPTPVSNGTYWIAVEFQAETVVCADASASASIDFGSESYGTVPLNWVPTNTVKGGNYNFYVMDALN